MAGADTPSAVVAAAADAAVTGAESTSISSCGWSFKGESGREEKRWEAMSDWPVLAKKRAASPSAPSHVSVIQELVVRRRKCSHPFGKAWSKTLFKADFVNFFLNVVNVRRTLIVKRGSMVTTARPMRVILARISTIATHVSLRLYRWCVVRPCFTYHLQR